MLAFKGKLPELPNNVIKLMGKLLELTKNVIKFINHYTFHLIHFHIIKTLMIMNKKKITVVNSGHYIFSTQTFCIINETLKVNSNKLSILFSFMIQSYMITERWQLFGIIFVAIHGNKGFCPNLYLIHIM